MARKDSGLGPPHRIQTMDQINLLSSTLFRLRSIVTGIQKAVVVLMYFAGIGAVAAAVGLLFLSAPWWLAAIFCLIFVSPVLLLWWWKNRLDPTAELLGSAHKALTEANSVDDLAASVGKGRDWVTSELSQLASSLANEDSASGSSRLAMLSPKRLISAALQVRRAAETVNDSFIGQTTSTVALLNIGTLTVIGILSIAAIFSAAVGMLILATGVVWLLV